MTRGRVLRAFALVALLAGCATSGGPRALPAGEDLPHPGDAAVLWIFVSSTCPIASAYAPEITRIVGEYRPRGVRSVVVYADPSSSAEEVARHAAAHGFTGPVVHDREHALVARAGVTRTPEAALFDGEGELVYRGRIDDRFPDLNVRRPEPTRRDLRAALEALLAGEPVETTRTDAVGCLIETAVR